MLTLAAAFSAFGAKADAIVLGTATDSTICSRSGPGSDRNCTWTYGALAEDASGNPLASNRALFKVAAQASADRSNSDASTSNAKADLAVSLILPYTVTRTVTVAPSPGGGYVATVPIQRLSLGFSYSGVSGTFGNLLAGVEKASIGKTTVRSQGGLFGPLSVPATRAWQPGDSVPLCPPASQTLCDYRLDEVVGLLTLLAPTSAELIFAEGAATVGLAAGSSVGEIGHASQLPASYATWGDLVPPFADYGATSSFEQSFSDALLIEFALTAESHHEDCFLVACLGYGGEALASAGMPSGMSDFLLDDIYGAAAGDFELTLDQGGFVVDASLVQIGETRLLLAGASAAAAEPATLALLVLGLAGLGWARRTRPANLAVQ